VSFSGQWAYISFQAVTNQPVPDPAPTPAPTPGIPTVDANAPQVEIIDTISQVLNAESVLLSIDAKVLWFNAATIVKLNDASELAAGLTLEFKAFANGHETTLIGIKVEVLSERRRGLRQYNELARTRA